MQITLPNEILLKEVSSLLAEGRDVELMTKGSSMLPFIAGGRDSVILRKHADNPPLEGDIVLARVRPDNYILHRIIGIEGDRITLRGDGNIYGTETVRAEDILGSVIAIVNPLGQTRIPGKARLWRILPPFVRRCILALYRRTFYILPDEARSK